MSRGVQPLVSGLRRNDDVRNELPGIKPQKIKNKINRVLPTLLGWKV